MAWRPPPEPPSPSMGRRISNSCGEFVVLPDGTMHKLPEGGSGSAIMIPRVPINPAAPEAPAGCSVCEGECHGEHLWSC